MVYLYYSICVELLEVMIFYVDDIKEFDVRLVFSCVVKMGWEWLDVYVGVWMNYVFEIYFIVLVFIVMGEMDEEVCVVWGC